MSFFVRYTCINEHKEQRQLNCKRREYMRQIIFHEETKTFHLYNEKISYILCVLENGHLGQLYFGKRLHDKADFSHLYF